MATGEKVWEGKGKGTGLTVKSVGVEGTSLEFNFTGELKGAGRLQGIGFRDVGTVGGSVRSDGIFMGSGQGFLSTKEGDTIVYKSFGMQKLEDDLRKGPYLITFSTASQKLLWMNSLLVVSEVRLDPNSQEYTSEAYEWR